MRPMLASRSERVPTGNEWRHEVKWDGMRVLVEVVERRVRITSRNENDVSATFPEFASLEVPNLLLDGEMVAFTDGRPDFGALAARLQRFGRAAKVASDVTPVTLLGFDLLRLEGRELCGEPLAARRAVLESLQLGDPVVQVPPTYDDGEMLLQATRAQELEGIVSKRLDSRYTAGVRSPHWLKFPHRVRTSWVIGGWRPEAGSSHRLGALLVGEPTSDGLVFRGRVGSGIGGRAGAELTVLLGSLSIETSPFHRSLSRSDSDGTRWVRPQIVVDVESLGFSAHGRLRQPSFRGVRADLTPGDLA